MPEEQDLMINLNEDNLSVTAIYTLMELMRKNNPDTIIFKNIRGHETKIDEVLQLILMAINLQCSGYKLVKEEAFNI